MPFSATVNFSAHFFATRPRPRQPLHVALSALWLLSLTVSAPAARLAPGPGGPGPDFVYLSPSRATAGQLQTNGTIHLQPLPQGATAAVAWRGQVLVFCGRRVYAMALPGAWRETARFEEEVREAVAVGDALVLLVGGARRDGVLRGARVVLWQGPPTPLIGAPQVNSAWHPFMLRTVSGRSEVLVGMRKSAHFDPVERTRPFLYRLADGELHPIWKGTSFSHPFTAATLVGLADDPGVAACALEDLGGGRRAVLMYVWTGVAMEAIARSAAGHWGDAVQATGPAEVGVFETQGARCRLVILRGGNKTNWQGVTMMQAVATGPWLGQRPAAWTTVWREGRRWLVYATRNGDLHAALLRDRTSVLPAG